MEKLTPEHLEGLGFVKVNERYEYDLSKFDNKIVVSNTGTTDEDVCIESTISEPDFNVITDCIIVSEYNEEGLMTKERLTALVHLLKPADADKQLKL